VSSTRFKHSETLDLSDLSWVREGVRYFRYPKLLSDRQLVHGVFTRHGGVSDPPYDSLNTSYTVGDRKEDVTANLRRLEEAMGARYLMFMNQCHGDGVRMLCQDDFTEPTDEIPFADAMITDIPFVALMVKQADCQGIIIFDPKRRVLANVHCGWRGNVKNILGRVLIRMKQHFGCKGSDMLAAIGPSLGPCCAEFVDHEEIFPKGFKEFMVLENHFNLWAVSCWQLVNEGVRQEGIEVAGICTRCRTDLFYSYRGEGKTGRFGTVAMLR
jgi:YfiH family protein